MCVLLVAASSQLGFNTELRWDHSIQYLSDIALLLLVACLEAQFDSFNALRHELRRQKRKGRAGQ